VTKMRKSNLICDRPPINFYFRKNRWVYYPAKRGVKVRELPLRINNKLLREKTPCSTLYIAGSI